MYGDINDFKFVDFLDKTYPTEDDSNSLQEVTDYILESITKLNVVKDEIDNFMNSFTSRLKAISILCCRHTNMDECEVSAVDNIAKSIDCDLKRLIKNKGDIMYLSNKKFFVNMKSIPDALKFYKYLYDTNLIQNQTRRQLEKYYNDSEIQSNFSNILFILSWLNVLRVYNYNYVCFNRRSAIYF